MLCARVMRRAQRVYYNGKSWDTHTAQMYPISGFTTDNLLSIGVPTVSASAHRTALRSATKPRNARDITASMVLVDRQHNNANLSYALCVSCCPVAHRTRRDTRALSKRCILIVHNENSVQCIFLRYCAMHYTTHIHIDVCLYSCLYICFVRHTLSRCSLVVLCKCV